MVFTGYDIRVSTDAPSTSSNTIAIVYNNNSQTFISEISNSLHGIYVNTSTSTTLYLNVLLIGSGGTITSRSQPLYPVYFKAVRVG